MSNRQIGPAGTAVRVMGAVALLVIAAVDLTIVDVPTGGIGWWDAAAVFLAFPLLAIASSMAVDALFQRLGADMVRRVRTTWSNEQAAATALVMLLVLGSAAVLVLLTPMNRFGIFAFVGLSMLFAAIRGYGGCELLALPKLLLRRDDAIWCPAQEPTEHTEERASN